MSQLQTVRLVPSPSALIESLRAIGYTLETALADLIDNSITAGASRIDILADVSGPAAVIAILDDGTGMTRAELENAMRPGSSSPLEARAKKDLGRFGLGMKTASFSQCRRLTVATRAGAVATALRWDLDRVEREDDWVVEVLDEIPSGPLGAELGPHGTMILWEHLDRAGEGGVLTTGDWNTKLDEAAEHLELVFHRFLAGERGLKKVGISLNGRLLEPHDPFFEAHPATQKSPPETIRLHGADVAVRAFTLPHRSKVEPKEWDRHAGRGGYLKNQGFYLYREKRLILHGTWFGLLRQTELTRLTRVRIDSPNSLDAVWKVDVKKASAEPPAAVRARLKAIIDPLTATSKRVYRVKGTKLLERQKVPVWSREQAHGEISYRINTDHQAFSDFEEKLTPDLQKEFRSLLQIAAASLPFDALYADLGSDGETVGTGWIDDDALALQLQATLSTLQKAKIADERIIEMISVMEPFTANWVRVSRMLSEGPGSAE